MSAEAPHPATELLLRATQGDRRAGAELLPLLYEELRRLARARLAQSPPGATLQPTALVHEAYLRIAGARDPGWEGRGHFFAAAAQAMREILIEQTRKKRARKRGGDRDRVELEPEELAIEEPPEDLLALDEALQKLEREDERRARIVMLRYFAGLTIDETAAAMELSTATVEREWRYARLWLFRDLGGGERNARALDSPR